MAHDLLRLCAIEAGYASVQVLWQVDLAVGQGQSVVLLGPNGAGKTTLLRVLLGLLPAWHGQVILEGADVTAERPDQRVRRGISYMSEVGVFPRLTVEENLRIGGLFAEPRRRQAQKEDLYRLFPDLAERPSAAAATLSGGQRKMLAIAKALAASPRLLVMDEPSAGLSPLLVGEVKALLERLRGQGLSLLIAEQNVAFLELADRVFMLEGGRTRFEGTVADLRADDALSRAFFGLG